MKHYDGKIRRIIEPPKGEIKPKKNLIGRISLVNLLGELQTRFTNTNALTGVISKRPTPIGKRIKRLTNRYVFFDAFSRFFTRHNAKTIAAPATEMEVDNGIYTATDTPLISRPGRVARVNRKVTTSVISAKLIAYNRAPFIYIKNTIVSHIADMIAAKGAIIKYRKAIQFQSAYNAESANSAIMDSYDAFATESHAVGCSAPTVDSATDTAFIAESMVTGNTAAAADVSVRVESGTQHFVTLSSWFYPEEVEDGLIIRQVYHAEESEEGLVLN